MIELKYNITIIYLKYNITMSQVFLTQTIYSDGSNLALDAINAPQQPYIIYNCKSTVNLNFLFREVLFTDPEAVGVAPNDPDLGSDKVSIVNSYINQAAAEADTAVNRITDMSTMHGNCIVMRLLNALMRPALSKTDINNEIIAGIKHYGGYLNGLASGVSVNTNSPTSATMDLSEFFQVALSSIRNKEIDSTTSGINGLVDRENINNAAIFEDLMARSHSDPSLSQLLYTFIRSATKSGVFANGVIDNQSLTNWMKQLIYFIVKQTAGVEATERYRPIRRTGLVDNQQERFMQLRLQEGDIVIIIFKFALSNASGEVFNTDCPDFPGTPMTIGYKITHSNTAPDYNPADTGTGSYMPVGWELSV
jgi:hypothetical protein